MPNFCIGIKQANKIAYVSLQEKGGGVLSGADDTYILGSPEIAFLEVKLHEERLASIGLKLNYSKMKCYIKETKNQKYTMNYETQRICRKDSQKVKMGRDYLAFERTEFQSEVTPLSWNG